MNKFRKIITLFFFILSVVGGFYVTNYYSFNNIELVYTANGSLFSSSYTYSLLISIVSIYLFFHFLGKDLKFIKKQKILFFSGVTLFVILSSSVIKKNKIKEYINTNGGVVANAKIFKKRGNRVYSMAVDVEYKYRDKVFDTHFRCEKEQYHKLNINDTVLVVHSVKYPEMVIVFNFFPKKREILRSREKRFYLNGEIVDSLAK